MGRIVIQVVIVLSLWHLSALISGQEVIGSGTETNKDVVVTGSGDSLDKPQEGHEEIRLPPQAMTRPQDCFPVYAFDIVGPFRQVRMS
jgi:hypothetical protein